MSKRPETPSDLSQWERIETLATFTLEPAAMRHRLLTAIDGVVASYLGGSSTEQPITIDSKYGGEINVTRPRSNDDIAKRLKQAQADWDAAHPPPAPELERADENLFHPAGVSGATVAMPLTVDLPSADQAYADLADQAHAEMADDVPEMMPPPGQSYVGWDPHVHHEQR